MIPEHIMLRIKKLVWTAAHMQRLSSLGGFSLRVQGKHPVTGGTSVAYFRPDVSHLSDLHMLISDLLFGVPDAQKDDFLRRVEKKVIDAYVCTMSVDGYDEEGDSISYELKFESQGQLTHFMQEGVLSLSADRTDLKQLELMI